MRKHSSESRNMFCCSKCPVLAHTLLAVALCKTFLRLCYGCPNGAVTNHGSTGHEWKEWQYVYSTRAITVTVTYTETLTEGGGGGRGESGSTCRVHDSYCVFHGYSDRGG